MVWRDVQLSPEITTDDDVLDLELIEVRRIRSPVTKYILIEINRIRFNTATV